MLSKSLRRMILTVAAAGAILTIAGAAQAVTPACRGQFQDLCGDVTPGGGRIAACIAEHTEDFSAACVASLETLCSSDIARYCGNIASGNGRIVTCLYARLDDLESQCRNAYPSLSN